MDSSRIASALRAAISFPVWPIISALEKFGIAKKKLGHVSLAGGAMLAMLGGKPLPCVQALDAAQERMNSGQEQAREASKEKSVVEGVV